MQIEVSKHILEYAKSTRIEYTKSVLEIEFHIKNMIFHAGASVYSVEIRNIKQILIFHDLFTYEFGFNKKSKYGYERGPSLTYFGAVSELRFRAF